MFGVFLCDLYDDERICESFRIWSFPSYLRYVCIYKLHVEVDVAVGFGSVFTSGGYGGGGCVGFEPTFIWVAGWLPMGVAVAVGSDLCVLVGDGWLQFLSLSLSGWLWIWIWWW